MVQIVIGKDILKSVFAYGGNSIIHSNLVSPSLGRPEAAGVALIDRKENGFAVCDKSCQKFDSPYVTYLYEDETEARECFEICCKWFSPSMDEYEAELSLLNKQFALDIEELQIPRLASLARLEKEYWSNSNAAETTYKTNRRLIEEAYRICLRPLGSAYNDDKAVLDYRYSVKENL